MNVSDLIREAMRMINSQRPLSKREVKITRARIESLMYEWTLEGDEQFTIALNTEKHSAEKK